MLVRDPNYATVPVSYSPALVVTAPNSASKIANLIRLSYSGRLLVIGEVRFTVYHFENGNIIGTPFSDVLAKYLDVKLGDIINERV